VKVLIIAAARLQLLRTHEQYGITMLGVVVITVD
jgi:hypothetical protein